jgi:hypothetical protein
MDPTEVLIVMSKKFPATVLVLGVISNEGDVMPHHVFVKGLKINIEEYLKVREDVVKPWTDQVAVWALLCLPAGRVRLITAMHPGVDENEPPGGVGEEDLASQLTKL